MTTSKKPQSLTQWEDSMPLVCWNCAHAFKEPAKALVCDKFQASPPPKLQETASACEDWEAPIPF